jgi:Fe-S-cluster containining protein
MNELTLEKSLSDKIADLYQRMEEEYDKVARQIGLTCQGCPDNCCDSFFQHHTYVEWAYLWEGIRALPEEKQKEIHKRSQEYITQSEQLIIAGEAPLLMCPVNENGLCSIYRHRLMICRLHGVPATITRPDGKQMKFPGCFRCQDITRESKDTPAMDRVSLFREMIALESELRQKVGKPLPKVKMTLAQMIVNGPPGY